jgi:arginase
MISIVAIMVILNLEALNLIPSSELAHAGYAAISAKLVCMKVCVVMVPYDSGRHSGRMGAGPKHLFERAIEPVLSRMGHELRTETLTLGESFPGEISSAFKLSGMIAETVRIDRRDGWFPLVLSGNCNAAIGSVCGCGCDTTGVVWFDAHGEATTPETTTSGFLDGMGISILTGQRWTKLARSIPGFAPVPGERIALVGSRDIEPDEMSLLKHVGVHCVSADSHFLQLVKEIARKTNGLYVHFDLDVLDPAEAVANQWCPPGGLSVASLVDSVKSLAAHAAIRAAGFASFDPEADHNGHGADAARMCVEALFSVPG